MKLFLVALACLLAWALWRLRSQTRIVRGVTVALREGHGFLRDHDHGIFRHQSWKGFIDAANALVEEKKQLEADRTGQAQRLKATLANMQEAVMIVDDHNRVLLANEVLHQLFSADNPNGEGLQEVFRNSSILGYLAAVREGKDPGRREVEFSRKGAPIWAEISASRISGFGGEPEEATLLVLHDTTRMRRLESVRKEFVANVSHELRTPLSLIKGYVETLADPDSQIAEADRLGFLKIIEKHTGRLERLVEDLLALSRLESGNPGLRKERLLLTDLIDEIVDTFRARDDAKAYNFTTRYDSSDAPIVLADPLRIAQVLGNLLENAVKYSGGSGEIETGLSAEGSAITVWVRDNGIGIAARDLPHIFERFYRADKGRSRESGGTGLGLSIVKHIIQLHGGSVWAESKPSEGTCVCFTLPVAAESDPG